MASKTLLVFLLATPALAADDAQEAPPAQSVDGDIGPATRAQKRLVVGVNLRVGGRYDDVRMCVGSPPGVKGGPALDIALLAELGVTPSWSLRFNLPVMRPILFGAAFQMLQLEPEITALYRSAFNDTLDLAVGPSIGLSLHYGPDYLSEPSGPGRRPSFFALGPSLGAFAGVDVWRGQPFAMQLGLHPYVTPLNAVDDPEQHRGVVVGAMLDVQLRYDLDAAVWQR